VRERRLTTTAVISFDFDKQLCQGLELDQSDIFFAQKIHLCKPLLYEGHHFSAEAIHRVVN